MSADGSGGGPDEHDAGVLAGGGEFGILAEEPVARVDGFGAMAARGIENAVDPQVAFRRGRGPHVAGLIGHANVQRRAIRVRIDCHRGDAHFAQGANDPDGDFSPIGNQNFAEHVHLNFSRAGQPGKSARFRPC